MKPQSTQIFDLKCTLGVPVMMFLKMINIGMHRLSKPDFFLLRGGTFQILWSPEQKLKSGVKENSHFLSLPTSEMVHQCFLLSDLNLDWNYTIRFLGSPACCLQILDLLNLHSHVNQSFIINHLYTTYPISSVCLVYVG